MNTAQIHFFFIYLLLYIYYKTLNIGHNLTLFA